MSSFRRMFSLLVFSAAGCILAVWLADYVPPPRDGAPAAGAAESSEDASSRGFPSAAEKPATPQYTNGSSPRAASDEDDASRLGFRGGAASSRKSIASRDLPPPLDGPYLTTGPSRPDPPGVYERPAWAAAPRDAAEPPGPIIPASGVPSAGETTAQFPATDKQTAEPVDSTPPDSRDITIRDQGETKSPSETKQPTAPLHPGEGDDRLQIFVKGGDIREVLAQLSAQGNLNILPTNSVQGKVSIALSQVSAETALDAVLRSTGYIARREGNFIFVGTEADFELQKRAADRVGTRVYRPNYIAARDLRELITPMLTANTGKISVTPPAAVGIQSDDAQAGGDSLANSEAILVQDFESVLDRIDRIVRTLDRRPPQVAIEAMILSVQVSDGHDLGVDFEFLRDQGHVRLASGAPPNELAAVTFDDGGLKLAFLDGSMGAFVKALERFGDTNVIATPKLMALNKQRAEILIGAQLGYVSTTITETAATQSVEFLEVGTQLRLRPFISNDGMVRLEVHPELSTGNVRIEDGITLPDKEVTKVTTNVMVRDGCTVILGGLMREDLAVTGKQVPWIGNLPVVGPLFRLKSEKIERREILVLLTPHIVHEPDACCESDAAAAEFHRRQAVFADKMSPLGKRYLGRKHFRLAQEAWALGQQERAVRHINLSIHIDPFNRAAIDLRSDIVHGVPHGAHTMDAPFPGPVTAPVPGIPVPDDRRFEPRKRRMELLPSPPRDNAAAAREGATSSSIDGRPEDVAPPNPSSRPIIPSAVRSSPADQQKPPAVLRASIETPEKQESAEAPLVSPDVGPNTNKTVLRLKP